MDKNHSVSRTKESEIEIGVRNKSVNVNVTFWRESRFDPRKTKEASAPKNDHHHLSLHLWKKHHTAFHIPTYCSLEKCSMYEIWYRLSDISNKVIGIFTCHRSSSKGRFRLVRDAVCCYRSKKTRTLANKEVWQRFRSWAQVVFAKCQAISKYWHEKAVCRSGLQKFVVLLFSNFNNSKQKE